MINSDEDAEIITNAAGDEVFETLRMQLEDERSQMKEELTKMLAPLNFLSKSEVKRRNKWMSLNDIAKKEFALETLNKSDEL